MQTRADAERAIALGANPQAVKICGNMKFDAVGALPSEEQIEAIRQTLTMLTHKSLSKSAAKARMKASRKPSATFRRLQPPSRPSPAPCRTRHRIADEGQKTQTREGGERRRKKAGISRRRPPQPAGAGGGGTKSERRRGRRAPQRARAAARRGLGGRERRRGE